MLFLDDFYSVLESPELAVWLSCIPAGKLQNYARTFSSVSITLARMRKILFCKVANCQKPSFGTSDCCLEHAGKTSAVSLGTEAALSFVSREASAWLQWPGLHVAGANIGDKLFSSVFAPAAVLENATFRGTKMNACVFASASFKNCRFEDCTFVESIFSSADFENCIFSNSQLYLCNFNTSKLQACTFQSCDMFKSRFIMANLNRTKIEDCNISSVHFVGALVDQTSFQYSNSKAAIFQDGL